NAVWGPRALSIYGVDGGNAAPDGSRATKLVKPVIAVAQPGATAIMRFVYDSLEFDDSSYFNSSYTGPGAVFVGTASTAASANIPQFLYGITAANLSAANALGTDAVAAKTMSGTAEIVGKADWSGSSIIASNFGPYDQIFSFSNNKYTSLRSDVKQLAAFSNVPDVYLGGRKGAASGNNGNVQGSVMAVTGIRPGSNTQVTAINEDITTRARFQTGWLLMANAILSGAAGITDVPRPVVYADVKTAFWTFEDINVQLEVLAEDTAGINATVAVKKYKINLNPLEPAYDAADADWIDIPADGKVSVDKPGVYYIHWFVENSKGVSSQGTFGPYMKNGPDYATTSTKNFVSMVETAKNSRIWVLTFNYVQTYLDGASEVFTYSINLNGNNANLDGAYKFTNGPLAGYTLVYDIKGNGSNIKDLRLI
ncbi:MAG: hypothetical protein FWH55_07540, partial [Oscillospiraceae bacterium]|nr:hypothetical protein [Oscillospiraceae bacterium]